jgi:hypothetical protein
VRSNIWRLYGKRVPQKLKDKFYRTTIRTMLYGAKYWPTKSVQQISVAKMCMWRWILSYTRRDQVQNDNIRDRLGLLKASPRRRLGVA